MNVEGLVLKRMMRRAQDAMKPLLIWLDLEFEFGVMLRDLHDSVQEGGCQGDFGGDVDFQIPDHG